MQGMFVVLDADALLLVGQDHSFIKGYRRAILTPNVMEFKRLSEQVVSIVVFNELSS
jgi:ATP-dependent NAD(P)H-hydrate dehydratase